MTPLQRFTPALSTFTLCLLAACGAPDAGPESEVDPFVPEPDRGVTPLTIEAIDKIDVLFLVDDSGSMVQEQAALAEQLPRMARALGSGDLDGDGTLEFPPPGDVQLGVVTSNLGAAMDIDKCEGLGNDGVLVLGGSGGCEAQEEHAFLRYDPARDDVEQLGRQFSCIAQVGTDGCGMEQPLEAGLKALWPGTDTRVRFRAAGTEPWTRGHGDGANAGFSRGSGGSAPSLLVIVLISDEDDCSASDAGLFLPNSYLQPDDPLVAQGLNVRCQLNPSRLYPVARYAHALRMLRPGAEQLVLFTAIAGVPPDLVSPEALAGFDYEDDAARDAFYQQLLDAQGMQVQIEDNGTPNDPGDDTPRRVCTAPNAVAYPARRITELARAFGSNGLVQSICQEDFGTAVGFVLERIAARMRDPS